MDSNDTVGLYDRSVRELILEAEAVSKKHCSANDRSVVGRAARDFQKCLEEIKAEGPVNETGLLYIRLGFSACAVLDAERAVARSVEGGIKRNDRFRYKRSRYQEEVDKLIAEGVHYTPACEKVAAMFQVHERTVRKYTTNRKPCNGGRRRRTPK